MENRTRTCEHCGKEFTRHNHGKIGRFCSEPCKRYAWYRAHREEENDRGKKWRKANPEKYAECKRRWNEKHPEAVLRHARRARILFEYGITHAEYERMLAEQGGGCRICHEPPPKGKHLPVDHCHATDKVRGLLCDNCNRGLGAFRDRVDLLQQAILYLNAYPSTT